MKIKIIKKANKKIKDFEKMAWAAADKEHYGKSYDWTHNNFCLVAYENKEIVGALEFHIKVGVAEIVTLIIGPNNRRQGIGKQLFENAEKVAKENGAHKLYLITGKGWEAEKFYQDLDMTKTGDMPNHYAHRDFVEYSKFI